MQSVVVVTAFFIIPLVENAQRSEIICTYYKQRCLSVASRSGSLKKESTPDRLACSLRCQGDHNCCGFFYNVSSSACVLQGDLLIRRPSPKCNGSGVWYIEKSEGDTRTCLEQNSERYEARTETTIHHQESTMGISQPEAPGSFQHIQNLTLHQACKEGRLDEVKYILSTGLEDINCRDKNGFTPVIAAALKGQEAVFDLLVSRDCDLSLVTDINNNVLHAACDGGNADIVRKLIDEQKFDIDSRGCTGWTPVMYAAYCGNRGIVDLLVRKGCNLRVVDDRKDNLLHVACLRGYVDVIKYIITHKLISIESRGNYERTPVLIATVKGHVEVVTLLVSYGCDVRATDDWKRNILHTACLGDHSAMVKHILGANLVGIDSKDARSRTAVMTAAEMGNLGAVILLEKKGCNLRAVTEDGTNLLHAACVGGQVDIVQHVFEQKIFGIESRDVDGRTPALIAAEQGHLGVVDFLRSKGCNLGAVDNFKNNILYVACFGGHADMVKYILKLNAFGLESRGYNGETAVMGAARKGHVGVVDLLKKEGSNMKTVDDAGNSILHAACFGGQVDIVQHIIEQNIFGIESRGVYGRTPVLIAAEQGHLGVVDFLRSKGCNLGVVDNFKNNILYVACFGGHADMVKYILKLNAFGLESRGYNGETAVMGAARKGHVGVVVLLKKEGCNMKTVDDTGNNILHAACIGGHVNMVRYLLMLNIVSRKWVNKYHRTPMQVARVYHHGNVAALLDAVQPSVTSQ